MIVLAASDPHVLARWQQAAPAGAAVARDSASLEALLASQRPALVLLDLQLDGLGGAAAAAELIGRHAATRVVVMSREPDEDEGLAALRAGARGYCNVYIDPRLLEKVITTVLAGEVWAGRKLVDRLVQMIASSRPAPAGDDSGGLDALTPREREIALLVGKGVSNKAIAQRLDITERTVKAHLGAVFSKLGVTGRLQLALRVAARPDTAGH
ncbi:response regulator transcription factor [Immundisolibacter sp.]|uniref:LuxR C-terminal-related transcriptional regulator n=1 Tax=Immundisolibacter sp. TaxID=1934948 RepID=UPI0026108A78|nr:response regulator transcription factor [Immundisolibacter sp.]MDD3651331.1 response regulator transcription factor [Immundisolibacter sp.]